MSVSPFPVFAPVRVLLVEDTDADAKVIEDVLHHHAFTVRKVRRLAQAITALRSDEFDVILSDLGLPDSTGLDTLETLLHHAGVPVVVMTGRGDESIALRAVAAGAQDYLVKGGTDGAALVRAIRYAVERGRAAEELNISEARVRTILDGALDAVVSINPEGVIVWWNRSAEEMFGWTRAEILGRPLADCIIPDRYRELFRNALQMFVDTGETPFLGRRLEWSAVRRDGSEFPVEVRITVEAARGGMTCTAFVSDIAERRRAEEERQASETRFRVLVEHASDFIFTCGASNTFTYVSPGVTRMLGYEPVELLARNVDDFIHPDDLPYVRQRFRAPGAENATTIPVLAEFRFRHRNGSWRYLEVLRADRLADPAVQAIVGNVRDVTGRRQGQQALEQLRRRYELILNGITDGVIGMDLNGSITFENPAAAAMLGWAPAELIGRAAHEAVHHSRPDGSPRAESECPTHWTLADGRVRHANDDVFWCKDGGSVRVAYTAAPMVDEQGRIAGVVVTFRDITRQKQMELQIEQSARVASLGRVSASVAHEFNNLLMGIKPFAEILKRKAEHDPSLEKPVRHMLNVTRRGQRLTEEILRFTNPAEPRLIPLDPAALIREFGDEAHAILLERRVEIEAVETPHVEADADQLSQVLLNLVTNARDATQTGQQVTIGAAPAASIAFLRDCLPAPEQFATLYVRDEGAGMSAETRERIFEPFFTARKRHGTGLGLAITARIVSQHGGHILIDSAPGAGSAFYVVLPVATVR
jgi:PAS domain S-box-containing protein